jgi:DNA-directed RNA polymerases I and III subunit RPAC1
MNVFSLKTKGKKKTLDIEDEWKCTMCRECIREDKFNDKIFLGKKRQQYKFLIESIGVLKPQTILIKAFDILNEKCDHYLKYFRSLK